MGFIFPSGRSRNEIFIQRYRYFEHRDVVSFLYCYSLPPTPRSAALVMEKSGTAELDFASDAHLLVIYKRHAPFSSASHSQTLHCFSFFLYRGSQVSTKITRHKYLVNLKTCPPTPSLSIYELICMACPPPLTTTIRNWKQIIQMIVRTSLELFGINRKTF